MMELFDEENIHTMQDDRWENYGTLNGLEDERMESHAEADVERSELLGQIFTMMRNVLTPMETDILCAYYGLRTKRLSAEQIAGLHFLTERRVLLMIGEAQRKLQFSDEAIAIWKYLYRK